MSITVEETRLIQKLKKFEIQCVTGNFTADDFHIDVERYKFSNEYVLLKDLNVLMKNISNHEYKKALQINSEFFKPFKDMCKDLTLVFYDMYNQMKSNYQYLFHSSSDDCPYVKQLILLLVGVSALQEFVKANICGPVLRDSSLHEICASFLPDSHFSNESVLSALGQNGEVILTHISHPKLLFLSLMLLFGNNFDKCLTHKWWLSRCMMIHQKILPDMSLSLYRSINSLIHSQCEISFLHDKSEPLAAFMFNCECAQFFMYYNELNVAERYIINAQNIIGLGIQFIKDEDEISQKRIIVKRNDKRYNSDLIVYNCAFPNCFVPEMGGNKIALLDHERKETDELSPEEQVVLLLYCQLLLSRRCYSDVNSYDDILILESLLSKPKIWSLQVKALILRCIRGGCEHTINQVNELIFHIKNDVTIFPHKLVLFYCTSLPMIYNMHKMHADVLLSTGLVMEALEIYKVHNLWKDSIYCYKDLDIVSVGVNVLEEEIAIKPSPLLWCYLGHLKDEVEVYQVAWDLSRHSNARAARYMGYYYYKHEIYDTSISHFKESLKLNCLQPKVLFCMGLAAMACNDFATAIDAFKGILEMDVDNCEAWIHLCKAYIKADDKVNACRCFVESTTFSIKTTSKMRKKFWENYLLISAKIRAFSDAISGFNSYLDEKFACFYLFVGDTPCSKYLSSTDIEVLKIIVNAIKTDTPDIHHTFSLTLKRKAIKLFKRIISKKCHYPIIWELYSVLLCIGADFRNNMYNTEKIINLQQRAIKYYIERLDKYNWSFEPLLKLLLKCLNLFDIYATNLRGRPGMKKRERINYYNFKLFLDKAVSRVKYLPRVSPRDRDLICEIEQKFGNMP